MLERDAAWGWLGAGAAAWLLWPRNARGATVPHAQGRPPGSWVWPVATYRGRAPVVSDGWGSPRDGGARRHRGVDVMFRRTGRDDLIAAFPAGTAGGSRWHFMPEDTPALAASEGRVTSAGWTSTGFAIVVDHGGGWSTAYRHLSRLDVPPTEPGAPHQVVLAGQPLGVIGANPLDAAGLRHLHFELRLDDRPVDPARFLSGWRVLSSPASAASFRNGGLRYRPVGSRGERYPDWVRDLKGKSGVYVIREQTRDDDAAIVYVGESHSGKLYETLTRHFQTWRRWKGWWRGQYGEGHDPGLTYDRDRVEVAVRVTSATKALDEEARLIRRLRPRDNLLGQPEAPIPF
ncbi:MAG: peptidoglycan DD-metalloendopeptidase family protein [Kofleriaceae bacterium]|nr:peptidoglycan DD-metalloendopeptidase family protein [Kofleriaceae bacterium]